MWVSVGSICLVSKEVILIWILLNKVDVLLNITNLFREKYYFA